MTKKNRILFQTISILLLNTLFFENFSFAASEIKLPLPPFSQFHPGFELPESIATVEESYQAPGSTRTIYLMQDAHTNTSGQLNLAKTLDFIFQSKIGPIPVFVEAGFGDVSLSALRQFSSLENRKIHASRYLRQGILHGEEYLDLTSNHDFNLYGVEDLDLYTQAIENYKQVAKNRSKYQDYLNKIDQTIKILKSRIYNPLLLSLDESHTQYQKGSITITQYLKKLTSNQDLKNYPHLKNLKKLQKLEQILEKQKQHYPKLSVISHYKKLSSSIQAKQILKELEDLETKAFDSLTTTQDERQLFQASKLLRFYQKLSNLALTPEEYQDYQVLSKDLNITTLTGFLNKKIMDLKAFYENALFLEEGFEDTIKASEEFYNLTLKRDQAFIENMTKVWNSQSAVLITGGYHTPNLKKLLKEKNISYVVLTPTITHETNQKRYEKILLAQKLNPNTLFPALMPVQSTARTLALPNSEIPGEFFKFFGVSPAFFGSRLASIRKDEPAPAFKPFFSIQIKEDKLLLETSKKNLVSFKKETNHLYKIYVKDEGNFLVSQYEGKWSLITLSEKSVRINEKDLKQRGDSLKLDIGKEYVVSFFGARLGWIPRGQLFNGILIGIVAVLFYKFGFLPEKADGMALWTIKTVGNYIVFEILSDFLAKRTASETYSTKAAVQMVKYALVNFLLVVVSFKIFAWVTMPITTAYFADAIVRSLLQTFLLGWARVELKWRLFHTEKPKSTQRRYEQLWLSRGHAIFANAVVQALPEWMRASAEVVKTQWFSHYFSFANHYSGQTLIGKPRQFALIKKLAKPEQLALMIYGLTRTAVVVTSAPVVIGHQIGKNILKKPAGARLGDWRSGVNKISIDDQKLYKKVIDFLSKESNKPDAKIRIEHWVRKDLRPYSISPKEVVKKINAGIIVPVYFGEDKEQFYFMDESSGARMSGQVISGLKDIPGFKDVSQGKLYFKDRYLKLVPMTIQFLRNYGGTKQEYAHLRHLADELEKATVVIGEPQGDYFNIDQVNKKIILRKDFVDFLLKTGRKKIFVSYLGGAVQKLKDGPFADTRDLETLVTGKKTSLVLKEHDSRFKTRLDDTKELYQLQKKVEKNDQDLAIKQRYFLEEKDILLFISDIFLRGKTLDARRLREMLVRQYGYYGEISYTHAEKYLKHFARQHEDRIQVSKRLVQSDIENLKKKLAPGAKVKSDAVTGLKNLVKEIEVYQLNPAFIPDPAFEGRAMIWDVEVERQDEVSFGGKSAHTGELIYAPHTITLPNFFSHGKTFQELFSSNKLKDGYLTHFDKNLQEVENYFEKNKELLKSLRADQVSESLEFELNRLRIVLETKKEDPSPYEQIQGIVETMKKTRQEIVSSDFPTLKDYFLKLGDQLDERIYQLLERRDEADAKRTGLQDRLSAPDQERKNGSFNREKQELESELANWTSISMKANKAYEELTADQARKLLILARNLIVPDYIVQDIKSNLRLLAKRLSISVEELVLAVRSSGVGEDSESASFAGRQDTYIFQTPRPTESDAEGLDHIVTSWIFNQASLFNKRAINYRFANHLPTFDEKVEISTLFQQMFLSDRSFIAFSIDRGTAFPSISTQWTEGQGEVLVSGEEAGDKNIHSYRGKLLAREKGQRKLKVVEAEGGRKKIKVALTEEEQKEYAMTDQEVLSQASDYFYSLHQFYESFVDLEGAVWPKRDTEGRPIYLKDPKTGEILKDSRGKSRLDWTIVSTQARPETVFSQENLNVIKLRRVIVTEEAYKKAEQEGKVLPLNFIAKTGGTAQGEVMWILDKKPETLAKAQEKIMVTEQSDPDMESAMRAAKGIVAIKGGQNSHTMIVATEFGLVAITGTAAEDLLRLLKDGDKITIDAERGKILLGHDHELAIAGDDFDVKEDIPHSEQIRSSTIVATVDNAFKSSALSKIPSYKGIGLQRLEIALAQIGIYPELLLAYDNYKKKSGGQSYEGPVLDSVEDEKYIKEIEKRIEGYNSGEDFYISILSEWVTATTESLIAPIEEVILHAQRIESNSLRIQAIEQIKKYYEMDFGNYSPLQILKGLSDTASGSDLSHLKKVIGLLDKTLYVRLDDRKSDEYKNVLGAEKFIKEEANPMKGYRGLDLLLKTPQTFEWQLKAIEKVAREYPKRIAVFAPVVRRPEDVVELFKKMDEVGLTKDIVKKGIMTEIPTNSINIEDFIEAGIDFISTGGNDVHQTVGKVDRNTSDKDLKDAAGGDFGKALLRYHAHLVGEIREYNEKEKKSIECGFCGNAPSVRGQDDFAIFLREAGYDSVSITIEPFKKVAKNLIKGPEHARAGILENAKFRLDINPEAKAPTSDYVQINVAQVRESLGFHYRLLRDFDQNKLQDKSQQELLRVQLFIRQQGVDLEDKNAGLHAYQKYLEKKLQEAAQSAAGKRVVLGTDDGKSTLYRSLLGGEAYETKEANPDYGLHGLVKVLKHDSDFFETELEALKNLRKQSPNLALSLRTVRSYETVKEVRKILRQKDLVDISLGLDVQVTANLFEIKELLDEGVSFLAIPSQKQLTSEMMALEEDNSNGIEITDADIAYQMKRPLQILSTAAQKKGVTLNIDSDSKSLKPVIQAARLAVSVEQLAEALEKDQARHFLWVVNGVNHSFFLKEDGRTGQMMGDGILETPIILSREISTGDGIKEDSFQFASLSALANEIRKKQGIFSEGEPWLAEGGRLAQEEALAQKGNSLVVSFEQFVDLIEIGRITRADSFSIKTKDEDVKENVFFDYFPLEGGLAYHLRENVGTYYLSESQIESITILSGARLSAENESPISGILKRIDNEDPFISEKALREFILFARGEPGTSLSEADRPFLKQALKSSTFEIVRRFSQAALGRLDRAYAENIESLLAPLFIVSSEALGIVGLTVQDKINALNALAEMGPKAQEANPKTLGAVRLNINHEDESVRMAAEKALAKISGARLSSNGLLRRLGGDDTHHIVGNFSILEEIDLSDLAQKQNLLNDILLLEKRHSMKEIMGVHVTREGKRYKRKGETFGVSGYWGPDNLRSNTLKPGDWLTVSFSPKPFGARLPLWPLVDQLNVILSTEYEGGKFGSFVDQYRIELVYPEDPRANKAQSFPDITDDDWGPVPVPHVLYLSTDATQEELFDLVLNHLLPNTPSMKPTRDVLELWFNIDGARLVEDLIEQLGSQYPKDRQKAKDELLRKGSEALAGLREASTKKEYSQFRHEIKQIIKEIQETSIGSRLAEVLREQVPAADLKMQIDFGTSGWRTFIPESPERESIEWDGKKAAFTMGNVSRLVQAIANLIKDEKWENPKVLVSYDARVFGLESAKRAVEVLTANGVHADLAEDLATTPGAGEITRLMDGRYQYGLAIQFTASHNPVYENLKPDLISQGVKVLRKGLPAGDDFTSKIKALANDPARNGVYDRIPYEKIPGELSRTVDVIGENNTRLRKVFDFDKLKSEVDGYKKDNPNFGVVIHSLNGATSPKKAVELFNELGILDKHLANEPLHKKTHRIKVIDSATGKETFWAPDPTKPWAAQELRENLKPGQLGFAFDGDGDRAVFIDTDGKTEITPNEIGLIFAHYLKNYRNQEGIIVRTLPTTRLLDRFAKLNGKKLEETPVGSKNFEKFALELEDSDSLLVAVEESGHIFFKINGEIFADSAIAEGLLALEIVVTTGKSLSSYLAKIKKSLGELFYNRGSVDSQFVNPEFKKRLKNRHILRPDLFATQLSGKLGKKLLKNEHGKIQEGISFDTKDSNGILVRFADDTWTMYRVSGTENVVRIYGEETTPEKLKIQEAVVNQVLKKFGEGARLGLNDEQLQAYLKQVANHDFEKRELARKVLAYELRGLNSSLGKKTPLDPDYQYLFSKIARINKALSFIYVKDENGFPPTTGSRLTEDLIQKLGSQYLKERDKAQKELLRQGIDVLPALREAFKKKANFSFRSKIEEVIQEIQETKIGARLTIGQKFDRVISDLLLPVARTQKVTKPRQIPVLDGEDLFITGFFVKETKHGKYLSLSPEGAPHRLIKIERVVSENSGQIVAEVSMGSLLAEDKLHEKKSIVFFNALQAKVLNPKAPVHAIWDLSMFPASKRGQYLDLIVRDAIRIHALGLDSNLYLSFKNSGNLLNPALEKFKTLYPELVSVIEKVFGPAPEDAREVRLQSPAPTNPQEGVFYLWQSLFSEGDTFNPLSRLLLAASTGRTDLYEGKTLGFEYRDFYEHVGNIQIQQLLDLANALQAKASLPIFEQVALRAITKALDHFDSWYRNKMTMDIAA